MKAPLGLADDGANCAKCIWINGLRRKRLLMTPIQPFDLGVVPTTRILNAWATLQLLAHFGRSDDPKNAHVAGSNRNLRSRPSVRANTNPCGGTGSLVN